MDKFVIKTPRESMPDNTDNKSKPRYRQATIESLQGVVVVEDILRIKSVLRLENQTSENLLTALHELKKKIPSREVMKSTKIGHAVKKVSKHENAEVSELAKNIVTSWSKYFEEKRDKPMIEVKCDRKTETMRKAGRKHLANALGVPERHTLPENIEREAFSSHKRLISHSYRRSMRTLVFTLKHQEDICRKVLDNALDVKTFVSMYKKEVKPVPSSSTS